MCCDNYKLIYKLVKSSVFKDSKNQCCILHFCSMIYTLCTKVDFRNDNKSCMIDDIVDKFGREMHLSKMYLRKL